MPRGGEGAGSRGSDLAYLVEPATKKCRQCKRELYANSFSMTLTKRRIDFRHHDAYNITCNECLVRGSQRRDMHNSYRLFVEIRDDPRPYGACVDAPDPEVFAPIDPAELRARAWDGWCRGCPVMEACGAWGEKLAAGGVWGGEARPWIEPPRKRDRSNRNR